MQEKQMTNEQKEELLSFIGIKSRLGIIYILQAVFGLLAIIGFLCPLFSYNLTKLDSLKETVSLMDVPIAIVGLLFLVIALVLIVAMLSIIKKGIAEEKRESAAKKLIGFPVGIGIACFLSLIMVCIAYLLYEVPDTAYGFLELDFEAGFYLFVIGLAGVFLCNLFFTIVTRKVLSGKISREQLLLSNKKEGKVKSENANKEEKRSLEEKLTELKRLRDAEIISEEEFETKKRELLNNLK